MGLIYEPTGAGKNNNQQFTTTSAVVQHLRSYAGSTEGSQKGWAGAGGSAYLNARSQYVNQVDEWARSQGRIAQGVDKTTQTFGTGDDTQHSDMSTAAGGISGVNTITNINV
ncbi:MAG: hypothetical protein ACRDS0_42675 [Pseudonocardiaceae bacterium]